MSVEKSLKQIIYEVSEIEKAHKQTRSFHFGDLLDIIKKGKVDYASIFMSVNNATTDENFTTLTVELYAFDILAQDDANRVDVENTTQQILDDFIAIIRYSTRWNNFCEVDSSVPERKFYDTLQDRLSGWSATVQVKVYRNDCLVGLPIDDYDFDQHGNFEAVVMAFVQNSEGTILASKLVSDSDDVIPVPNITITDTDGTEIDYPSGKNFACTPPTCEDADIFINGVEVSNVPSGGTVDLQVVNEDDEQVGAWDGSEWVVPNMNVDFEADKLTADIGEDIDFTDLTTNAPTNWSWQFDNEGTSNVQNPTFAFATAGLKTISLLAGKVGLGGFLSKLNYIEILEAFLLDLFPNSATAFSLRKLRKLYVGSAIRVRRSSDNAEQDIGFNSNGSLNVTNLLSFVGAGDGTVVTWYDQSTNGRNATQSTLSLQPYIVQSGVLVETNGKPSVFFNQSEFLETGTFTVTQPATQFAVGKIDSSYNTSTSYTIASSNVAGNRMHIFYRDTNRYAIFSGNVVQSAITTNSNQFLFSALFNSSNSELRRNGNQIVTGNAGSQNFGNRLQIGRQSAGFEWFGTIQEFIFYHVDMSADFNVIEAQINENYDVF